MDRKVRTLWLVRRRCKIARLVAAALGALAGIVVSLLAYGSAESAGEPLMAARVLPLLILVIPAAVPCFVVEFLWRRARRRRFWEWQ